MLPATSIAIEAHIGIERPGRAECHQHRMIHRARSHLVPYAARHSHIEVVASVQEVMRKVMEVPCKDGVAPAPQHRLDLGESRRRSLPGRVHDHEHPADIGVPRQRVAYKRELLVAEA